MSHDAHHEQGFLTKYIFSTNHKTIGKQFLFSSLFFLFVGGLLALSIRWQMAYPGEPVPVVGKLLFPGSNGAVSPEGYTMLFTMHGTIMIFFVVIPILVGAFGNFLIPLHVGAKDMAFPVLNMMSYWVFFPSGIMILIGFFVEGGAATAGWTGYSPLANIRNAAPGSGAGIDWWILGMIGVGTTTILGAVNYMTTILKMRAPGLTMSRLPLTTWAQFITSLLQLLATPVLAAALVMLFLDRTVGTTFFVPDNLMVRDQIVEKSGGQVLLWQHLFWFYSHPAVYIMVLPAMGIASDLLAVGCRKPVFGYGVMVASMCGIAFLGFIVWAHHMFQAGMNPYLAMAFMTSTMVIALPSGVKVFNWLATMWGGSIRFDTPTLCAIAFVAMFIIGGLSGIYMAATPVDIHIHDTYYIVAHFHYVVFGGSLFAVFGGIYFWFPKMFGRMMSDGLGKLHFWITLIAFNAVFFPMHLMGAGGFLRRVGNPSTYDFLKTFEPMSKFITISAFVLGFAQLIFVFNLLWSMFKGRKAEPNPWQATTLEWTLPSPAPEHNYPEMPTVHRGPYEYSTTHGDYVLQTDPPKTGEATGHH